MMPWIKKNKLVDTDAELTQGFAGAGGISLIRAGGPVMRVRLPSGYRT